MSRIKRYLTALRRYNRSRGFGIHSPFAFYFVRRVLREKCPYYAYDSLRDCRRNAIKLVKKRQLKKRILSDKNARMLFRIACYFKPETILQIGSTYGVSSMALLGVSRHSRLVVCMGDNACGDIFDKVTASCSNRIENTPTLSDAVERYNDLTGSNEAFVLINTVDSINDSAMARQITSDAIGRGGVVIMRNLNNSPAMKALWQDCAKTAGHGMTFTNYRIGIIVARHYLPRQNYTLWF